MTVFGIIWIMIMFYLLFKPTQYFVFALILSSIFQATSVLNIEGRAIQPFFITEIFFIIKFLSYKKNLTHFKVDTTTKWLFLFLSVCLVSSTFYPELFGGIEVYPGNAGIDDNVVYGGLPLSYSLSNLIQSIYLIVHVITFHLIYQKRKDIDTRLLWKTLILTITVFIFIGILQYINMVYPTIPYPSSFLYNNKISQTTTSTLLSVEDLGINRISATFTEPSFAGVFIAASFWALFPQKGLKYKYLCIFLFLCLIFNLSSIGIVSFLAGALIYAFLFRRKSLIWIILSILLAYYIITQIPYLNVIFNGVLLDKLNSGSGINRTSADIFSWNLFLKTDGLGVGLGSHRTSSFLFNMLSNIGVIGFVIWTIFIFNVLKPLIKLLDKHDALFVVIFSLVLFCGQIAGVSELNLGIMWMWIFVAVIIKGKYVNTNTNKYSHAKV